MSLSRSTLTSTAVISSRKEYELLAASYHVSRWFLHGIPGISDRHKLAIDVSNGYTLLALATNQATPQTKKHAYSRLWIVKH